VHATQVAETLFTNGESHRAWSKCHSRQQALDDLDRDRDRRGVVTHARADERVPLAPGLEGRRFVKDGIDVRGHK
jgi:hypothetical protein